MKVPFKTHSLSQVRDQVPVIEVSQMEQFVTRQRGCTDSNEEAHNCAFTEGIPVISTKSIKSIIKTARSVKETQRLPMVDQCAGSN